MDEQEYERIIDGLVLKVQDQKIKIGELRGLKERFEKALLFYENPENYKYPNPKGAGAATRQVDPNVMMDEGEIAQIALGTYKQRRGYFP